MNWATDRGLVHSNPRRGYKCKEGRRRITYFTPEQEQALLGHASTAFALALEVLIRTGYRPSCEFAVLTAAHVEETPNGQVWRFGEEESTTGRPRVVYVPSEIASVVRELMKRYPTGPVFRNGSGQPWSRGLKDSFRGAAARVRRAGVELAPGSCLYSCRHTFAKRTLGGYWTGKPATIEQVAGLMGNTRQICWDYYAQWCAAYSDPLWDALGRDRSVTAP